MVLTEQDVDRFVTVLDEALAQVGPRACRVDT
jgi:hypothetical protein